MGWCLGGYFATETLHRYFEINASVCNKFQCFINNKSFTNIKDFLYYIMPKYTRVILKFWPISLYVNKWNSDSNISLEHIESNFQNIYVIYSKNDNIVNGLAHFYKHVNKRIENIKIRQDIETKDHKCNWNFLAEILKSNG